MTGECNLVSAPTPARESPAAPDDASLRVDVLDAAAESAWSTYVADAPGATVFHALAWKHAVETAFGHRPIYLIARRGRTVRGILPLFQVDSLFAGTLLVSVPYATYGGIVADDTQAIFALDAEALALARRIGARSCEYRSLDAMVPDRPAIESHATFQKELPGTEDGVLSGLPRKARAAARKAGERGDLHAEFGHTRELLRRAWRLYSRSMRRLASPNYPMRFWEALQDTLEDRLLVQITRRNHRDVAALVTLLHRDTVMPYFVGIDDRCGIYGLSQHLYAESMRWGVRQGFRRYDFGRSRYDNPGSFEFKRLCGFDPRPLRFQRWVADKNNAPDLRPSSPRWSAARAVWKRLPLTISRPLGGWVARSFPG